MTDVVGLRVGHAQRIGEGWLTGTTVVLAPDGGAVAAVDVRGGGPGTRETDALDPRNLVQRIDAVVLTGGSAFGLDSASGVAAWLEEQGRGFRVGPHSTQVVPVVPAAALFDLGRGGDWRARPDAALGRAAAEAAGRSRPGAPVARGNTGAGTGAVAGGLKGGTGTASLLLPSGFTVAALAVVNALGSVFDLSSGALYGQGYAPADHLGSGPSQGVGAGGRPGGGCGWVGVRPRLSHPPTPAVHAEAQRRLAEAQAESLRRSASSAQPPLNTTLVVVATDAVLTRAQAQKLAGTAHDGLARAVRPVHLLADGDTVFALATGERPLMPEGSDASAQPVSAGHPEIVALNEILAAGADAVARAVLDATLCAEGVDGPGGVFPSYRELYGPAD
ncbi:P1 family peptidase [Streptomyces palmae]|uniref:P1 family peptidase n=1 Tax=Streptomyces palmae TaxID=1701085 RepID=UPI001FD819DA|nr:P1 family peptidase [Streptomyces palmae]